MISSPQYSPIPLGTIQIPLDNELVCLLNETHYALGVLDGMFRYMPDAINLKELLQLRESYNSTTVGTRNRFTFSDILKSVTVQPDAISQISNVVDVLTKYSGKELNIEALSSIYATVCGQPEHPNQSPFRNDDSNELYEFSPRYINQKEIAPLMEDTLDYLQRNNEVDILIKVALAYYQFITYEPFAKDNAIMARLLIHLILGTRFRICASCLNISDFINANFPELNNKLWETQRNRIFPAWVHYFVNIVKGSANRITVMLTEYEKQVVIDLDTIVHHSVKSKAVMKVYDYFKQYLVSEIQPICVHTGLSFNTVSKAIQILQDINILEQEQEQSRHRVFVHKNLLHIFSNTANRKILC